MFVEQIDMIEALRPATVDQEINIMTPNTSEPKRWADYSPDILQNLLEGRLFFRDGPTMDNFELECMMCGAPPIDKNESGSRDSSVEDRSAADGHPRWAKRVDKGKVTALHEAGRSNRWIADDTGLHERTMCRVLKRMKEGNCEKDQIILDAAYGAAPGRVGRDGEGLPGMPKGGTVVG